MKRYLLLVVFCLSCFVAIGAELSEKDLKRLRTRVKISSVDDLTIKNEDREKVEVVKIYTYQEKGDPNKKDTYRIRVAVELTDKEKNTYFARAERAQGKVCERGSQITDYLGRDDWEMHIPHGNMDRPKVTAYAIQYGILNEGEFIVLAEDYDDVDSMEELMERTTTRLENVKTIDHYFWYEDKNNDDTRSQVN